MKLFGKNPVRERLMSDPGSIHKLYLQRQTDLSDIVKTAKKAGIYFESVSREKFLRLCGKENAQGVMAEISDFKYAPFDAILSDAVKKNIYPVFIDGVTDPQNLGSIIRSLACMGGFSIVLPEHRSVRVNETVLRIACGGENHIRISSITNTVKGLKAAHDRGLWVAGAAAGAGESVAAAEIRTPLAVVIGSEGKGIRPGVLTHLDAELSLSMRGADLSYNVSVATALFCYEVQRKINT